MTELDLVREWYKKRWISQKEYLRLSKIEKRTWPCGCLAYFYQDGKPSTQMFCGEHLGFLPKFNDFHPITNQVKF